MKTLEILLTWLTPARALADLTIAASTLFVARALYALYRRKPAHLPAPRLVATLALLVGLCGLLHVALLLSDRPPAVLSPTALKALAAAIWAATALRLPPIAAHLAAPPAITPDEAAGHAERIKDQARDLERLLRGEPRRPEAHAALREIREILVTLEAVHCRN